MFSSVAILSSVSDLLINLSAGWFGVAVIIPPTITKRKLSYSLLLTNIILAILSLVVAIDIRSF